MPGAMPIGGTQRHLELRVVDRAMGMVVTDARVSLSVQGAGAPQGTLTLARMYSLKEGLKDLHYGANVGLGKGVCTLRVRVDGRPAVFHVRVS